MRAARAKEARRRALAFLDGLDEGAADRLEPFPGGRALLHPELPLVWDINYLRLESRRPPRARDLAREAERLLGGAGLNHRLVLVAEDAAAACLRTGFGELGWGMARHRLMALRRGPAPNASSAAEEVTSDSLEPAQRALMLSEPWGTEDVVTQVLRRDRLIAAQARERCFALRSAGRVVSWCRLLSRDGVGQVEDVGTLPGHRNRGLARAVVSTAAETSRRHGDELTFIVADADDWPQELYTRLGFDPVGVIHRFRSVSVRARG